MADFAGDALALADHLSWQRFALIGISFGGMVAQEVAIAAPDRVTRMVLACTSSGGPGGSSSALHEVLSLPQAQRAERLIGLVDVRTAKDPLLRAQISERLATVLVDPDEGARRQLEARRHHDTFARLREITAPTLVAAGRHDGLAPLANSRALADAIAGARLEVFEGGHAFLDQDPSAWPAVSAFLASSGE
jgi:3-oxoadipate enol-lactonase